MTNAEIRVAINDLKDLENMITELTASANAIKDAIKAEMKGREVEVIDLGNAVVRNTTVISNRFDTSGFKKFNLDLYNEWIKQVVSHKFSIA